MGKHIVRKQARGQAIGNQAETGHKRESETGRRKQDPKPWNEKHSDQRLGTSLAENTETHRTSPRTKTHEVFQY